MSATRSTPALRVLVVGNATNAQSLDHQLGIHAQVEHVPHLQDAIARVQREPIDLVITAAAELMPGTDPSPRQAKAVLDALDEPVCLMKLQGEITWSSMAYQSASPEIQGRMTQFGRDSAAFAASHPVDGARRECRSRFRTSDESHYEMSATPIVDSAGKPVEFIIVCRDTTLVGRVQSKLEAIDQAGRELLSLDTEQFSRLDPQERLSLIEQKILRYTRDLLHFDNFEIRVLDRSTNKLELVLASSGVQAHNVELLAEPEGHGICGYVATKGRSYICPDVENDARYLPGVEGARSSLTVPLFLHDRIIGVANFESTKVAAFNEDDRQFAEIFGRYVSLALHLLQILAQERQTTTCKIAKNVLTDITAPLNDVLTDVENLVEDYIGHDDLRHRLRAVSDHVQKIREGLQQMASPRPGLIPSRATPAKRQDTLLEGKRILIADDEEIIRETVRDVLTGYGCEVCAVADGEAAIEMVRSAPFDLVLSDIKMPLHSGYEVFAAAKQANPATPVILTTGFGYDPNHCIIRARREGLAAVLFKPFKIDQLLCEIRTALNTAIASQPSSSQ